MTKDHLEYEVTREFESQPEKLIARFAEEKDAVKFMEEKLGWDHRTRVPTKYRVYCRDALMQTADSRTQESLRSDNQKNTENHGASKNSKRLSFDDDLL